MFFRRAERAEYERAISVLEQQLAIANEKAARWEGVAAERLARYEDMRARAVAAETREAAAVNALTPPVKETSQTPGPAQMVVVPPNRSRAKGLLQSRYARAAQLEDMDRQALDIHKKNLAVKLQELTKTAKVQ